MAKDFSHSMSEVIFIFGALIFISNQLCMYILFKILHSLSFSAELDDCHLMNQKALTRVMTEPVMNRPSIYSPLWESQVSIGTGEANPNFTVA